jgi:hypothetical protein
MECLCCNPTIHTLIIHETIDVTFADKNILVLLDMADNERHYCDVECLTIAVYGLVKYRLTPCVTECGVEDWFRL